MTGKLSYDDFDADAMASVFEQGMSTFAADPERADRLKARANEFTWRRCALEYAALYREYWRVD